MQAGKSTHVHPVAAIRPSASAVEGGQATAVFVPLWDILNIGLLTKTCVAAELFGLQMNMTTRWKDDSHEHDGISFALPQVSREVTLKVTHTN